jgi:hypothetical protein
MTTVPVALTRVSNNALLHSTDLPLHTDTKHSPNRVARGIFSLVRLPLVF